MADRDEETLNENDDSDDSGTTNEQSEVSDNEAYESIIQANGEELSSPYVEMNRKKKKALLEFRCMIEDAILGNYLLGKPNQCLSRSESTKQKEILKETTLWGVPLLPSKNHEGTDIVLLKFLRAKDFHIHNAFQMLRRTLKWRKEYKADQILEEKLSEDIDINLLELNSKDKEGHPLCYSVYEGFRDRETYEKAFGSEEKCEKFLRWKIQYIEKGIKKLEFKNGGVNSIVQITDLKNSPGPVMKELRSYSKKALLLLQDNYPELIHKNIIINAPIWYYGFHLLRSRLLTQKTMKKFVFARSTNVTKTLLKYIAPENLPVQYGGLKRENDNDFTVQDKASELKIKGNSTISIEFPVRLPGVTMIWDVSVVGWEVSYKEEFIPEDEGSYRILIKSQKRIEKSVRSSFYISEPGKILITIYNSTFKKKRVLYRSKAKPTIVPMYVFLKTQL